MAQNLTKIISLNVGQPRSIEFGGRTVVSSILKQPVFGSRHVSRQAIEGDRQADLRVHGGTEKAVYLYPAEHYPLWNNELELEFLEYGTFGENLTSIGLLETTVCIGDRYRIGSAILQVSQPRMPCFKLQMRFGRSDMVKRFWQSGRSGIYFSVVEEGELASGDAVEKLLTGPEGVTVADVVRLYKGEEWSAELRDRALHSPLRGSWKTEIRNRLTEVPSSN